MLFYKKNVFYPQNKILSSFDVNKSLENTQINENINSKFKIKDICSLDNIYSNSIVFIDKKSSIKFNEQNILIITNDKENFRKYDNSILVNDLNKSFNLLANDLYFHDDSLNYKDDFLKIGNSYVSKYAKLDSNTKIGINCVIGRGVSIGKNTIIKNNVVIKNSIISDNVIISDNSTIGCTGFGFDLQNMGSKNMSPHLGIVYIDENVSIGSNCTIDKAKIDITYIGKNSMIDNLVHIAHNVIIGDNACIAAQTGIAGSVKIGKNLVCGGQSAFSGHIKIGNNVIVAGKSGVTKNIKDKSTVAGFPAIDIKQWKKSVILNRKKNA